MAHVSSAAAFVALVWAAVLAWLAIGALIRRAQLERRFRSRPPHALAGRRVLLIRPCAGDEPNLLANLCSATTLRSQAELTVVMTVDDPRDGARPVVEEAVDRLRAAGVDARLEIHPPTGPNRKASLLAAVLAGPGTGEVEFVVNADSNVDLEGFELDALLAPLLVGEGPDRVGTSWAPWAEQRSLPGLGARASEAVTGGSLTAFPLLCGIYPSGLVGKLWAARRDALEESGGLDGLTHYLGEDLAMAERLRAAGWGIAVAPVLGRARGGRPSFSAVVTRFARWMLAASQRPLLLVSYPLFFFATPLVLMLAALGALARPSVALSAVGLCLIARGMVTLAARYWSRRGLRLPAAFVDAALSDLVLMLAWLRAVSSREVAWRGHTLRVGRDGRLSAVD